MTMTSCSRCWKTPRTYDGFSTARDRRYDRSWHPGANRLSERSWLGQPWFHYYARRKWGWFGRYGGGIVIWPVRWQGWALIAAIFALLPATMVIGRLAPSLLPVLVPVVFALLVFLGAMNTEEVERIERRPGDMRN